MTTEEAYNNMLAAVNAIRANHEMPRDVGQEKYREFHESLLV